MVLWKNRQLHAVVRKVDEDGLDPDNSPFLKLSLDDEGLSGGKPHPRR
jgi:hypothetical protein